MAKKSPPRPPPVQTPYTMEPAPAFPGSNPPGFAGNFNKKFTPGAPAAPAAKKSSRPPPALKKKTSGLGLAKKAK